MKSIMVPRNSIPPAQETLVIQITPNEAKELLDVCEMFHRIAGHKYVASSGMVKHLEEYLKNIEGKKK